MRTLRYCALLALLSLPPAAGALALDDCPSTNSVCLTAGTKVVGTEAISGAPYLRVTLLDAVPNPALCGEGLATTKLVDVFIEEVPSSNRGRTDVPNRRLDPPRGRTGVPNGRQDVPNRRTDVPDPKAERERIETPEDRMAREEIQVIVESIQFAGIGEYTVKLVLDTSSCSEGMETPAAIARGVILVVR